MNTITDMKRRHFTLVMECICHLIVGDLDSASMKSFQAEQLSETINKLKKESLTRAE